MGKLRAAMLDWRAVSGAGVLRYSGAHFLIALVLLYVVAPFLDMMPWGDLVEGLLISGVMVSAVMAVGARTRVLFWSIVLLSPALAAKWATHIAPNMIAAEVFPAVGVVFVAFIAFHLFQYMLRAPKVNAEVLCTGVATFLTLALLWAFAYVLVDRLFPGSFAFSAGPPEHQAMRGFVAIYFSLVTLCTVGFGDIVPVSGPARMLAMLEGVAGVFYVAIMVARLVTLYSSRSEAGGDDKDAV